MTSRQYSSSGEVWSLVGDGQAMKDLHDSVVHTGNSILVNIQLGMSRWMVNLGKSGLV